MEITVFEVGNIYYSRSICDHECIFRYKVLARTAKFVTVIDVNYKFAKPRKFKVFIYDGCEAFRLGCYSMAPTVRAEHKEKPVQQEQQPEQPADEKQQPAEKQYINPTFIGESDYYINYEYLGVRFKVRKGREQVLNTVNKCREIDSQFEAQVNEIIGVL